MDERQDTESPVFDIPQTLVHLGEIERCVLAIALDKGRGVDCQLHACTVAHKLLLDRLIAIEMRNFEKELRFQDRAIARNRAERDRWD